MLSLPRLLAPLLRLFLRHLPVIVQAAELVIVQASELVPYAPLLAKHFEFSGCELGPSI